MVVCLSPSDELQLWHTTCREKHDSWQRSTMFYLENTPLEVSSQETINK